MSLTVRPATTSDLAALGRMGAELVRQHHGFDAQRFMLPGHLEDGYRRFLGSELGQREAVVLVAEQDGAAVGYAYGRVEERDWATLRERCGGLHDLWVDAGARRLGVGERLTQEVVRRLTGLGVPRVILMTAVKNETAQRLFTRLGWRTTMVELTRETDGA
jgi:ribosomal protein S18 acetylase RimI-like enzyme